MHEHSNNKITLASGDVMNKVATVASHQIETRSVLAKYQLLEFHIKRLYATTE